MSEHLVYSANLGELESKIAEINKRATKLGVTPISLDILGTETKTVMVNAYTGVKRTYQMTRIAIDGAAVKLPGGWQFIAAIQPTDAGNLIRTVPGEEIDPSWRTVDGSFCDHCKLKRSRAETFLVRDESGTVRQIGRSCLRDFLGHVDPEHLASMASLIANLSGSLDYEDEYERQPRGAARFSTREFVATTSALVRCLGWISRASSQNGHGQATADWARAILAGYLSKDEKSKLESNGFAILPEDESLADSAIAWGRELTGSNDYQWNLRVSLSDEWLPRKSEGIAASVVTAYQKHLGYETEKRVKADSEASSAFLGKVGERITTEAVITSVRPIESDWGTSTLVMFNAQGNILKWFYSGFLSADEIGETVKVTGTVKAHETYKGVNQTALTRCKLT